MIDSATVSYKPVDKEKHCAAKLSMLPGALLQQMSYTIDLSCATSQNGIHDSAAGYCAAA